MAETFKFGNTQWATKKGSVLAYNDQNNNFKPLPFTFTRDSGATYVDSDGLIKVVSNGWPRIDYTDNPDGHLLLEPLRRNLIPNSNPNNFNVTSSGGTAIATVLDNGLPGLQISCENQRQYYTIALNVVSGITYTLSFYVDDFSGNLDLPIIVDINGRGLPSISDSNLVIGRNYFTWTATSSGATAIRVGVGTLNNDSGSITFGGFQLEDAGEGVSATYATSYIPTNGEINGVTRAAETCTGAGNAQVFNDSEGVLFANIAAFPVSFNVISLCDGGVSDRVSLAMQNAEIRGIVVCNNTPNQIYSYGNSSGYHKIAIKYGNSSSKLFIDGVSEGTAAITTFNDPLTKFEFAQGNGGNNFYGKIKQIGVYDTALTDEELETLTT